MAAFIESPVTRQARPSDDAVDVTLHVFTCRIREDAIQRYCDTYLNVEPGTRQGVFFQAARGFGGLIMIESRAMPLGVAPSPPEFIDPAHLSGTPNVNKFTVSIPVWRYDCGPNNILSAPEVCWIQPILVFNNSTLVFQARETVGFDAFHGAIGIGPNTAQMAAAAAPWEDPIELMEQNGIGVAVLLSTIVDFSPISPKELLNFMTISTGPASETMPPIRDEEQNLQQTTEDLMRAYPYFLSMLESRSYEMSVVTLKQFRGFPDIRSTVYQSLSEQTSEYTDIKNLKYYDPAQVEVTFFPTDMTSQIIHDFLDLPASSVIYGSHPLDRVEQELGKKFSRPPPIDTVHGPDRSPTPFAFRFDAQLQPRTMKTLYTFT
jgi:hypothetical protein